VPLVNANPNSIRGNKQTQALLYTYISVCFDFRSILLLTVLLLILPLAFVLYMLVITCIGHARNLTIYGD
jgi:hypothetical protein